jgi:hypothetical protein
MGRLRVLSGRETCQILQQHGFREVTECSRPRSWNTVLSAATRRRSRPIASSVLEFTSVGLAVEVGVHRGGGRPRWARREYGVTIDERTWKVVPEETARLRGANSRSASHQRPCFR